MVTENHTLTRLKNVISHDLFIINFLTLILSVNIFLFPSFLLRAVIGFPFILFFPGYVLLITLYPRKDSLDPTIRTSLSFALSISITGIICLILNSTGWGIRLESVLYSLALFILLFSVVGWFRQRRFVMNDRHGKRFYKISFSLGQNKTDKVLSSVLIIVGLAAIATAGFAIFTPKTGQTFTEFYVLAADHSVDYPSEVGVGSKTTVIIGLVNHEAQTTTYRVDVNINDVKSAEVGPVTIEPEGINEQKVTFVIKDVGQQQKVQFNLYKNDESTVYMEPLRLWFDVK
ncbi:MAG: DUF1616 domain-containing protein [Dehalococcoidales bacterium]|nr:DUF1616 domain-containing protein [Dehalococcoidales bacterium]